jgi:hypothetical protein
MATILKLESLILSEIAPAALAAMDGAKASNTAGQMSPLAGSGIFGE